MTTIAKADKSRLIIRGLIDGQHYSVQEQPGGWFVRPEKATRVQRCGLSAEQFAKLYRERSPLDSETAAEVSANIAATRNASHANID